MSVKNKNSTLQCPNNRKHGSDYCGVHKRCKNVIRIDQSDLTVSSPNLEKMSLKKLKKVIDEEGLTELILIKGKKKKELLKDFKECKTRIKSYQDDHEKKIVKIQSALRDWNKRCRSRCVNTSDLCTYQPVAEIPAKYFFSFRDVNGYWYGFDIRTFNGIITSTVGAGSPINPYSRLPIPMSVLKEFKNRLNKLSAEGVEISFRVPKLTSQQKMRNKMLGVFQKIDMLDNYTDYRWFKDLNQSKLRRLYLQMQDIWNYRCQMSSTQKKRVVHNGRIFERTSVFLKKRSLDALRGLILDEFNRMVTEGVDQNEKKLGAMLILTGLVQVSKDAAQALPQYVQIP